MNLIKQSKPFIEDRDKINQKIEEINKVVRKEKGPIPAILEELKQINE